MKGLTIELGMPQETIMREIGDKRMKQRDVAQTYALLIRQNAQVDWAAINEAIISRWSLSGLERIKNMAHSGKWFIPQAGAGTL